MMHANDRADAALAAATEWARTCKLGDYLSYERHARFDDRARDVVKAELRKRGFVLEDVGGHFEVVR